MQKKYLHRSEVIICSLKQCVIEYGFKPVKANMGQITPVYSGPRGKQSDSCQYSWVQDRFLQTESYNCKALSFRRWISREQWKVPCRKQT